MKVSAKYRILMFAPAFAPFANAEGIVNSKLALAMQKAGWEVDVISRKLVGTSDYDYGSGWVDPWLPLREITHEVTYDLGGRIERYLDALLPTLKLGYPVEGCRWAANAYDLALSLHKKKSYNVIISRAFPASAHLPAMKMSKKMSLPWIANWNDPWEFMTSVEFVNRGLKSNIGYINSFFCKSVGKQASQHSFPSDNLRGAMCKCLGDQVLEKSVTIPHIALPLFKRVPFYKSRTFRICYSGRLWPSRDPTLFLQALKKIIDQKNGADSIKFVFVGIDDVGLQNIATRLGINSNIETLGNLSYSNAMQVASACDVLLVLDPPAADSLILTSKFVDYVQTGRPILVVSSNKGTLNNIISLNGGGIVVDCTSFEAITSALGKLYSHWGEGTLNNLYNSHRLLHLFSPEVIIAKYEDVFHRIGVFLS